MPYAPDDPRAQLAPAAARRPEGEPLPPQSFDFTTIEPDAITGEGGRSWIVRATNVVFVYTELAEGDLLERTETDETLAVVLGSGGAVSFEAGGANAVVAGRSVVAIPPGHSRIIAEEPARLVRLFATTATELAARSRNAEVYQPLPDTVAVTPPWPEPPGGPALRVYDDVERIEPSPRRMGRIFRNRHAMVNVLYPRVGPRDPGSLSPHSHEDFEQLSFVEDGRYTHHVRTPWGTDRRTWRPDEHLTIGGPSLTIIPPPLIHTSEAVGEGENRMLDIFAGPRADFSARPGWVLNAEDYPAPADGESA
ncbi:hypothetical protein BAY61_12645 [Prauserella marina]|uniref:Uncharacterized protein n=1 Tax=Prauserella marina TaxID=530584 RepID=A0A222VZ62_9PSEU|nr:hypothetical protein [Prauserella marina]ASR39219.1 hypothetical protein BAY61_12645 [Prauserella marina]PWV84410.1 hypothetical protein DES30_101427 [Prauserella marina]SDC23252.1 hypothetical protein SAMN05421630_101910 [Prauserella marina]